LLGRLGSFASFGSLMLSPTLRSLLTFRHPGHLAGARKIWQAKHHRCSVAYLHPSYPRLITRKLGRPEARNRAAAQSEGLPSHSAGSSAYDPATTAAAAAERYPGNVALHSSIHPRKPASRCGPPDSLCAGSLGVGFLHILEPHEEHSELLVLDIDHVYETARGRPQAGRPR
jgi:hypothetical protein